MRELEPYLKVGVIASAHGLHGEVNVYPTTDDPSRFLSLNEVFLGEGEDKTRLHIVKASLTKKFAVLKFREFTSIEEAEKLRQMPLYVDREHAVDLEENEYFITDLIGMDVLLEDGTRLGTLADVMTTAANDVYVVRREKGSDVLIPAVSSYIRNVRVNEGAIVVHLIPGMAED